SMCVSISRCDASTRARSRDAARASGIPTVNRIPRSDPEGTVQRKVHAPQVSLDLVGVHKRHHDEPLERTILPIPIEERRDGFYGQTEKWPRGGIGHTPDETEIGLLKTDESNFGYFTDTVKDDPLLVTTCGERRRQTGETVTDPIACLGVNGCCCG